MWVGRGIIFFLVLGVTPQWQSQRKRRMKVKVKVIIYFVTRRMDKHSIGVVSHSTKLFSKIHTS